MSGDRDDGQFGARSSDRNAIVGRVRIRSSNARWGCGVTAGDRRLGVLDPSQESVAGRTAGGAEVRVG